MIEFNHVNVVFREKKRTFTAVKDATFKIEEGEIFGIVGSSGAGKSTLLRTINKLQDVNNGEVIVDNNVINSYKGGKLRDLRKNIGMIFQHFNLAGSKTVYQNIEFVLREAGKSREEADARIKELLEFVGLSDKIHEYSGKLSGGQKQRVAIARALANDTKILLCDEPTSALDVETTASVLALLKKIREELGITIVIITHELEVVKEVCDRIAVMYQGEVVELGNVYDVFTAPQHEFTKRLLSHTQQFAIPEEVTRNTNGSVVKLIYLGERAKESLISEAAVKFNASFNILHGKIEYIGERPIGILYIHIDGEDQVVDHAITFLKERTHELEVVA